MHRETPAQFSAPFFKKHGIKPFVIDPQTMDVLDEFFQELLESLKSGYDHTKPIIIAVSDDERVSGQVIDGRHRLYGLAKLKERGVPLPSPFPKGEIEVKDIDHLRALIASYEARGMSKGAKYQKAHIERNLKGIIKDNEELHGKNMLGFIKSLGFTNEAIASRVVDDYMGPAKTKLKKQPQVRHVPAGLPESLAGAWPQEKEVSAPSVYADKDEDFNIKVSYHNCPQCNSLLKIMENDKNGSIRIEAAPKIRK